MLFNFNQVMDHNKAYWSSLVDLKLEGWKSFSKATNAYTNSFFKPQLDETDKIVEKTAKIMKGDYNVK